MKPTLRAAPATTAGDIDTVAICGSSRFRAEITHAERALTLAGALTLVTPVFDQPLADTQKDLLIRLHRVRIAMCHRVFVVDPGGYIGEHTANEISYADSLAKPVFYWSKLGWTLPGLNTPAKAAHA